MASSGAMLLLMLLLGETLHMCLIYGQYGSSSPKFQELMTKSQALTRKNLTITPYTKDYFYPDGNYVEGYSFIFPLSTDYRIYMLIDPCRYHNYSCCMNSFGSAEYPSMRITGHEQERQVQYAIIGGEDEVSSRYDLIYEDGSAVPTNAIRRADDESVIDLECEAKSLPYTYCMGTNYALKRSAARHVCMDNNQSLNSLSTCFDPITGEEMEKCVQVAYSQNAFIPLCNASNSDCGTYLEVHSKNPYFPENQMINQVKIETRNTSGAYTTILNTNFLQFNDDGTVEEDLKKVLCFYSESFLRVGSIVYIKKTSPICCCPRPYKATERYGSFLCPKGYADAGPTAPIILNLEQTLLLETNKMAFPFCPYGLERKEDNILCVQIDVSERKSSYVTNCSEVPASGESSVYGTVYSSVDLMGKYAYKKGRCRYPNFESCAETYDTKCYGEDTKFSFVGKVGKVTLVDNSVTDVKPPSVFVTFNDGRTSYEFWQTDVQLETYQSMYELWWVVKSKTGKVVRKRKGFNVTSPLCTYDSINDRYFPYTMLDKNDKPIIDYPEKV